MEEFARGKLTKMQMLVEGRQSVVLLDSCSSASIITRKFLTNHLNRTEEDLIGPVGSIKGIGDTITRDLGRIRLRLTIWNRVYVEEFIVIDNAGFPGDVLLSADAMGRCGLCIDFRTKTITSKDSEQKVTFCLQKIGIPVNRAHLPETDVSQQTDTSRKLKEVINKRKDSALQLSKISHKNVNDNEEMVPFHTNTFEFKDNRTDVVGNTASIEGKRDFHLVKNLMKEVSNRHEEKYVENNKLFKVIKQIDKVNSHNNYQIGAKKLTDRTGSYTRNNNSDKMREQVVIDKTVSPKDSKATRESCFVTNAAEVKTAKEVLYLGKISRQTLQNEMQYKDDQDLECTEYSYFLTENEDTELLCLNQ